MKYNLICGLEIHTELKTKSKMFCACPNDPFHAPKPNFYTCPVCLGLPGALPVANATAIEWTVKLGLLLGCKINRHSKFDRKNYFYPDLPKGYQISQYDLPFCYQGAVTTSLGTVRINRIHLEEDTAKLLHQQKGNKKVTLIDFNRSSVPLIEIVTEPDIKSSAQAIEYAKKIRATVRQLGISNADMQKGGLRLEANISLQTPAQAQANQLPNYKVEVKNINSFNFMGQAIDYEIKRQTKLLNAGETIGQETRGWDSSKNKTFLQRRKENAADYRYFPDPDLPEITFTTQQIKAWRQELPLSSSALIDEWAKKFHLPAKYASAFIDQPEKIAWAQKLWLAATAEKLDLSQLANYLVNKKINFKFTDDAQTIITLFRQAIATDNLDDNQLTALIKKVLTTHPHEVTRYQNGEKKLLGFFMGQIMKSSSKKLSAPAVNHILLQQLKK
jgi:aspartyl-tRNA(Asn)/glutamyl-tRNA(Gln) amidotransferase subunit B